MRDNMEISIAKLKYVAALRDRKNRRHFKAFTVEGTKIVLDTLNLFNLQMLIASSAWLEAHKVNIPEEKLYTASPAKLKQMSALSTAPEVIAVYELPEQHIPEGQELKGNITLLLDDIQDPGNLGTIIRAADWFGVKNIVASPHTVDLFNPKTIQATMGALARVNLSYTDLPEYLNLHSNIPLYCTMLEGENIYDAVLPQEAFIAMGNEGNGLSEQLRNMAGHRLFIPPYPREAPTVESLNVAMATAIVLSQFRKNG